MKSVDRGRIKIGACLGRGPRYLLAFVVAAVLSLGAVVPVLAAEGEEASVEPQVVGGGAVPNGKYPFMASLQGRGVDSPSGHFCGATLIDRDSVLTAAHCVDLISARPSNNTISFRDVRVVVGTTVLRSDQGQTRRIASFSDIEPHPRFDIRTYRYDAAVIDLSRPVTGIRPIKLAAGGRNALENPGRRATVTGWGNTFDQSVADVITGDERSRTPNRMREVNVPVVSDREAKESYDEANEDGFPLRFVPPLMVAAGESDKDSCQGDSGGPLFSKTSGGPRQTGITSFGFGCGALTYPGVYAEVNSPAIRSFVVRAAGS